MCCSDVPDGVKYSLEEDGLRIHYIQPSDSGIYECRAEVVSQGNLKVQTISVDVLCKCILISCTLAQRNRHIKKCRLTDVYNRCAGSD